MQLLRRIKPHELQPGMTTPGDIYDRDENVILERESQLTADALAQLPDRVYTDESWPSRRTGACVADEVFRRLGRQSPKPNQRAHPRRAWTTELRITIGGSKFAFIDNPEVTVTTIDISRGGYSFFYRQYLPAGTPVEAHFDMLPDRPSVRGIVRNCRLMKGMNHRVGVAFTNTP